MSTLIYIERLTALKSGDLGLLRNHAGQGLDESIGGFDLFTGLWWPLRQKDQRAPKRSVAWLIAKLYAFCPVHHSPGDTLAYQLGRCQPSEKRSKKRFRKKFDGLLISPVDSIEPGLQWALNWISSRGKNLDWAQLTDDLSIWQRESKRVEWAKQFLKIKKG